MTDRYDRHATLSIYLAPQTTDHRGSLVTCTRRAASARGRFDRIVEPLDRLVEFRPSPRVVPSRAVLRNTLPVS